MTPRGTTPLTLLTGFLGAGKTTVLNRILAGEHGLRIAVMVNDFGDLDIAEELISGRTDDTLRLTNGCICCSLKEDLVGAVMDVLHRPDPPEHIVLEASGVADPTGIATTLLAPVFGGRVRLDGVICIVDTRELDADHAERDLVLRQLMVSDLVLLNKVDTVDGAVRERAESLIRGWLSRARILPTVHGDAPLEVLLSSMRAPGEPVAGDDPADDDGHACGGDDCDHPAHAHHRDYARWYYRSGDAMDTRALTEVARELPASVYRVKGITRLAGTPTRRGLVQGVGRRLEVTPAGECSDPQEPTRLVVIGAPDGLDPAWLQRRFDACRVV